MSPNGDDTDKKYGEHKYASGTRTSDCNYGCKCWMGPTRSGGPIGLDPFGECPNNPEDEKRLGGDRDYRIIVERRIDDLTTRASEAEGLLEQVEPGTIELAKKLEDAQHQLSLAEHRAAQAVKTLTPPSQSKKPPSTG